MHDDSKSCIASLLILYSLGTVSLGSVYSLVTEYVYQTSSVIDTI